MIPVAEFKKSATLRQRILLWKLMRYADKERETENLINYFYDSNNYNPGETHLLEDIFYKELEKIEFKIRKGLNKAIELGMEDVSIVTLNINNY